MKTNTKYIGLGILSGVVAFMLILSLYNSDGQKLIRYNEERVELINESTILISSESNANHLDDTTIQKLQNDITARENNISRLRVCKSLNEALQDTMTGAIDCNTIPAMKLLSPDELFYTIKIGDKPYVSQKEDEHFKSINGGMLATDIATGYKAEIYAPDYLSEVKAYTVTILEDNLLGNYAKLSFTHEGAEYEWIIAHLDTKLTTGDIVYTGQRIGQMDKSGATTGYHSHVELWKDGTNISTTTRNKVLMNKRAGVYESDPIGSLLYFTSYDLGDVSQNDSDPCIGAEGTDLCQLSQTGVQAIALTVDQRKLYDLPLGSMATVQDSNKIAYEVRISDELNKRYRHTCIRKQGACIKGDIARYNGSSINGMKSGLYTIIK